MFTIENRKIGLDVEPFIIAEMSGNHNQSLERALEIVDAAADAGAHALKIQTYRPDTITMDCDGPGFIINDSKSLWNGRKLFDLYAEAMTPWEWHLPIIERSKKRGIICFSSPFDLTAVDFLEDLNVPCYKVASFENIDFPLLKRIAKTQKPVILSSGASTASQLDQAVSFLKKNGTPNIAVLKCTSTYPALPLDTNLRTIAHMRDLFDTEVGLSDHTMGVGVAVASVAFGATVIEKHFTLSRAEGGVDSAFSLEPHELKSLVIETKRAWQALGKIQYGPTENEKQALTFKRSLYIVKDIQKGEIFTEENLRSIRPGYGLIPTYYEVFLGKKSNRDIRAGTPLSWDMIG